VGKIVGATLLLGMVAGFVTILIVAARFQRRQQERRDELSYRRWQQMNIMRERSPGAELVVVDQVYQRARRGCKAVIVWQRSGIAQDSWFEGMHLLPGDLLLVRGSSGWGPHNNNPNVFYVGRGQVLSVLPRSVQAGAARHRHGLAAA